MFGIAHSLDARGPSADDPISLDDYFRIGSNTKTMTAAVILQLVQEGKLSLDDPLSKYVAGFPNGDQITIAHLAEIRSGLGAYTSVLSYNQALDDDPTKAWAPEELLDLARRLAPSSRPASSTATRTPTTRCSASSSSS